jgi:hypothetical protein
MPERIRAFIPIFRGIRRMADSDAIEDENQRAHRSNGGTE